MNEPVKCELCGEPMPRGEEMFKFHGYRGPCPKPLLPTITQPNLMTRDDVMRETVKHVRRVGNLMLDAVEQLQRRAMWHDDSKFEADEFDAFAKATPQLRGLTYGSPEYRAALAEIRPAVELHYHRNRHHPEYFIKDGVLGMDLLDLIEMLADWKAAGERHADGDLRRSIEVNAERFGYDHHMKRLLLETATNLGWLDAAVLKTGAR